MKKIIIGFVMMSSISAFADNCHIDGIEYSPQNIACKFTFDPVFMGRPRVATINCVNNLE